MDIKLQTVIIEPDGLDQFIVADAIIILPYGKRIRNGCFKKNIDKTTIFIKGEGDIDLLCGQCDSMLAIELENDSLVGQILLKCSKCQSVNIYKNNISTDE